ncbi:MAG: hypothetical protein HY515_03565, partial [Candidatus Aenigmarchaeota archaeon]|nr:hypothetical protein [Candidatus Aenigmarchaeota archaeon]
MQVLASLMIPGMERLLEELKKQEVSNEHSPQLLESLRKEFQLVDSLYASYALPNNENALKTLVHGHAVHLRRLGNLVLEVYLALLEKENLFSKTSNQKQFEEVLEKAGSSVRLTFEGLSEAAQSYTSWEVRNELVLALGEISQKAGESQKFLKLPDVKDGQFTESTVVSGWDTIVTGICNALSGISWNLGGQVWKDMSVILRSLKPAVDVAEKLVDTLQPFADSVGYNAREKITRLPHDLHIQGTQLVSILARVRLFLESSKNKKQAQLLGLLLLKARKMSAPHYRPWSGVYKQEPFVKGMAFRSFAFVKGVFQVRPHSAEEVLMRGLLIGTSIALALNLAALLFGNPSLIVKIFLIGFVPLLAIVAWLSAHVVKTSLVQFINAVHMEKLIANQEREFDLLFERLQEFAGVLQDGKWMKDTDSIERQLLFFVGELEMFRLKLMENRESLAFKDPLQHRFMMLDSQAEIARSHLYNIFYFTIKRYLAIRDELIGIEEKTHRIASAVMDKTMVESEARDVIERQIEVTLAAYENLEQMVEQWSPDSTFDRNSALRRLARTVEKLEQLKAEIDGHSKDQLEIDASGLVTEFSALVEYLNKLFYEAKFRDAMTMMEVLVKKQGRHRFGWVDKQTINGGQGSSDPSNRAEVRERKPSVDSPQLSANSSRTSHSEARNKFEEVGAGLSFKAEQISVSDAFGGRYNQPVLFRRLQSILPSAPNIVPFLFSLLVEKIGTKDKKYGHSNATRKDANIKLAYLQDGRYHQPPEVDRKSTYAKLYQVFSTFWSQFPHFKAQLILFFKLSTKLLENTISRSPSSVNLILGPVPTFGISGLESNLVSFDRRAEARQKEGGQVRLPESSLRGEAEAISVPGLLRQGLG